MDSARGSDDEKVSDHEDLVEPTETTGDVDHDQGGDADDQDNDRSDDCESIMSYDEETEDDDDANGDHTDDNRMDTGAENTLPFAFVMMIFFRIVYHFRLSINAASKILAFISFVLGMFI